MAQYIDTSQAKDSDFWDASNWRKSCRESAGLRGIAPAVHFRSQVDDTNSSLSAKNDRVFHIHTHNKLYIWGSEMYAGGYDTLDIYWMPPNVDGTDRDDTIWDQSGGWILVKGSGRKWNDTSTATNRQDGTPELLLSGSGVGPFYPGIPNPGQAEWASQFAQYMSLGETLSYLYDNWLLELRTSSGNMYAMSGPHESVSSVSYHTARSNFLRSFFFIKDGYWKIVLKEEASPRYKTPFGSGSNPPSYDASVDVNNYNMQPVNYTSNTKLYGSLDSQIESSKNPQVNITGVRYRSNFTRQLNIRAFHPNIDLVTKSTISFTKKVMSPSVKYEDSLIDKPYTKVVGYGSSWGDPNASLINKNKSFIETKNSSGQKTPSSTPSFPDTSFIGVKERFSGCFFRHTDQISKRIINRRHLFLDGVSVFGFFETNDFFEQQPCSVVSPDGSPSLPNSSNHFIDSSGNYVFPDNASPYSPNSPCQGWIVDFRGSVFNNCTFKNIDIGTGKNSKSSIWSGCSFVNCNFINCGISPQGDSVLLLNCSITGNPPNGASCTKYECGNSFAIIGCKFMNNDRQGYHECSLGPFSDNLWYENVFDDLVNQDGGGELMAVEFPISKRALSQKYCFSKNGTEVNVGIQYRSQQHEVARNMWIFNHVYKSNGSFIGFNYNSFSRGNLFYGNSIYCQHKISTFTEGGGDGDASYYDLWAHNVLHNSMLELDGKTYHFRFLLNMIAFLGKNKQKSPNNSFDKDEGEYCASFSIKGVSGNSAPRGGDYCINSSAIACKFIKNRISNWNDFFDRAHNGSCSVFKNFHHVYDQRFNINQSSDAYWGPGNLWKYVNIAHKNSWEAPLADKKGGWSDGSIGRVNPDGSPYMEANLYVRQYSNMPLEWPIYDGDTDQYRPSKCSDLPGDISARKECNAIYVKTDNDWIKKNTGDCYGADAWSQQIFKGGT